MEIETIVDISKSCCCFCVLTQ